MPYHQFEPPQELKQDMRCLWVREGETSAYQQASILPDSYLELVINCGPPLMLDTGEEVIRAPRAFLLRLQKQPICICTEGPSQTVGVQLYAWSAWALLGTDGALPDTPVIVLGGMWNKVAQMVERAVERGGYDEAIRCLQDFLSDSYRVQSNLGDLRTAGEMLYASQGRARMADLAAKSFLSTSQFQRRFKALTGISAKSLARLIRFETARNTLIAAPDTSISDLVHDLGYTDQAHLIHDFKAFAAQTPSEFAARLRSHAA